ncbi:hypothetical protein, partial [Escherichia coli]|uniref:hypothetical protein n=1 Tax=Escherichia coli TaxID=562 RepID=UPI00388F51E5
LPLLPNERYLPMAIIMVPYFPAFDVLIFARVRSPPMILYVGASVWVGSTHMADIANNEKGKAIG